MKAAANPANASTIHVGTLNDGLAAPLPRLMPNGRPWYPNVTFCWIVALRHFPFWMSRLVRSSCLLLVSFSIDISMMTMVMVMVSVAYRHLEEHIAVLIQGLEPTRIIREFIPIIRGAGIPQENTLHLPREIRRHLRIILHHIAIARIRHQHKLPLRIRLEDLGE